MKRKREYGAGIDGQRWATRLNAPEGHYITFVCCQAVLYVCMGHKPVSGCTVYSGQRALKKCKRKCTWWLGL